MQLYSVLSSVASLNESSLRCVLVHLLATYFSAKLVTPSAMETAEHLWKMSVFSDDKSQLSILGRRPSRDVLHWRTLYIARRCPMNGVFFFSIPFQDVVHFTKFVTAGLYPLRDAVHCEMFFHFRTLSTSRYCPLQNPVHCRKLTTSRGSPLQDTVHFRTLSTSERC